MKKVLSIFCLLSALNLAIPAFAAPPPHAKGHRVVAGPRYHHPPHVKHHPKCYSGNAVIGGVLARRSCWGYPYCDYRLGCYDDFYYYPAPKSGIYVNVGFPVRF